jgi:hypothetical protein
LLSWPGFVPAISLRLARPCVPYRDCRNKSGNDKFNDDAEVSP